MSRPQVASHKGHVNSAMPWIVDIPSGMSRANPSWIHVPRLGRGGGTSDRDPASSPGLGTAGHHSGPERLAADTGPAAALALELLVAGTSAGLPDRRAVTRPRAGAGRDDQTLRALDLAAQLRPMVERILRRHGL